MFIRRISGKIFLVSLPKKQVLNKNDFWQQSHNTISEYHEKYLKQFGVKLPKLYAFKGKFTKDVLVLVYLAYDYPKTRKVSKEELTKFVRSYFQTLTMYNKHDTWVHKLVGG